jgi:hypothetical protein
MKIKQTECSEISAYKIQTPGNYPEESTQNSIRLLFKQWRLGESFIYLTVTLCVTAFCYLPLKVKAVTYTAQYWQAVQIFCPICYKSSGV